MKKNIRLWALLGISALSIAAVASFQGGQRGPQTPEEQIRALQQRLRQLEDRGIASNPFVAGRSMTLSRKGIVASSHTLASQAGLDMLRSGGSAMETTSPARASAAATWS